MLDVYSCAKDGRTQLSTDFTVREFACKDGSDPVFIDSELVTLLQTIRSHFDKPVLISSAFRTAAHNKAIGGAAYSQHCYGRAADIHIPGVSTEQLASYVETLLPDSGGIGHYPAKGFVHVDVRQNKSRWTG